jgi:hypothetical protein
MNIFKYASLVRVKDVIPAKAGIQILDSGSSPEDKMQKICVGIYLGESST